MMIVNVLVVSLWIMFVEYLLSFWFVLDINLNTVLHIGNIVERLVIINICCKLSELVKKNSNGKKKFVKTKKNMHVINIGHS